MNSPRPRQRSLTIGQQATASAFANMTPEQQARAKHEFMTSGTSAGGKKPSNEILQKREKYLETIEEYIESTPKMSKKMSPSLKKAGKMVKSISKTILSLL
jgi:hypothetical protein